MQEAKRESRVQRYEGGPDGVMEWLSTKGVERVRVEWTDLHGVARGKCTPLSTFEHVLDHGLSFAALLLAIDIQARWLRNTHFGEDIGFGDFIARPDLSSLRVLRHEPNTAQVMSSLYWPDGRLVTEDARNVLIRVNDELKAFGFSARAAPEFEFYLLDTEGKRIDTGAEAYSMQKRWGLRAEEGALIDAISAHADYEASHYEYGPGQYEITIRHDDMLRIADSGHLFRTTMKEAAIAMDRWVTFMAKPFEEEAGNSCHFHFSLIKPDGTNAFSDADDPLRISQICRHFIGGVLAHLQELALIYLPNTNSYKRLVADSFAPISVAWGMDNRVAAVRVINLVPDNTRIELRVPGGDVNIYLGLAALMASGLDGLKNEIDPGPPGEGHLDYQDFERITDEWTVALRQFEESTWAPKALGEEFCTLFKRLKRMEHARIKRTVTQEERNELMEFI